ncbi:hypothetical protein NEIG_00497 [Nematocida sp. ERTm5]|nr:hypothetical protein NEIG_00497 [Nematocida sp. ERTm5]
MHEYDRNHLITFCSLDIANGCAPELIIKLIVAKWKSSSNPIYSKLRTINKYTNMDNSYFPKPDDRKEVEYKFIREMCTKLELLDDMRFQYIYIRKIIDQNFKAISNIYKPKDTGISKIVAKIKEERKKNEQKVKNEKSEDLENNQTIDNLSKENQQVLN